MSRNNDVNEQRPDNGSDIDEVTQLCHEYSNERENFHKLGFQCLLKKLREIEKIILAISKISGNDVLQIQGNTIKGFENDIIEAGNSSTPIHLPVADISLPNNLTYHSKQVLQTIFEKFETSILDVCDKVRVKFHEILNESYCEMDSTINALNLEQKAEAKSLIEALLSSDVECVDENTPEKEQLVVNHRSQPILDAINKLQLPADLNPFTRLVLNEIFENYVTNLNDFAARLKTLVHELLNSLYGRFESDANGMTEKQKSQLRLEMETIFAEKNPVHPAATSAAAGRESNPPNAACLPFDTQLARHFQELSRLVGELLDKKDNTEVTIDENQLAVVPNDVGVDGRAVVHAEDDVDETQYTGVEKFKSKGNRFLRLF